MLAVHLDPDRGLLVCPKPGHAPEHPAGGGGRADQAHEHRVAGLKGIPLGKVQRVALTTTGDTYTATVSPFLPGLKQPVPVIAGPDGEVLVGDWSTGTIYRVSSA